MLPSLVVCRIHIISSLPYSLSSLFRGVMNLFFRSALAVWFASALGEYTLLLISTYQNEELFLISFFPHSTRSQGPAQQ